MKTYQLMGGLMIIVAIMSFTRIPASQSEASNPDDHRAVLAANAEFYKALNAIFIGDLNPMTKVWSHAEDVTYMGPVGGFQKGWKSVRENWVYQAEQRLGGDVEPEDIHINTGPQIAIVHNLEKGTNVVDGQTQVVSIRATNIFRKEKGQWKMIGHHTDLLPFFRQ